MAVDEPVECELCGALTPYTETKRCNRCWQLQNRIHSNPDLAWKIFKAMPRRQEECSLKAGLLFAALDEADTAFAVLNICEGLTPQARDSLKTAWFMVQEALALRVVGQAKSIYDEAVKEARAAYFKDHPEAIDAGELVDALNSAWVCIGDLSACIRQDMPKTKHLLNRLSKLIDKYKPKP